MAKRPPRRPNSTFIEEAKLDGMHPHDFLRAVMRAEHILINGVQHRPTFEQRLRAAESLSAALEDRTVPDKDDDDFYSPPQEEKGNKT